MAGSKRRAPGRHEGSVPRSANSSSGASAVDSDRLLRDLEALARFGRLDNGGVDRPAFSGQYRGAVEWLSSRMRDAGLRVWQDPAGNLIGRVGPDGPALLCGSHIDSVPSGGIFDGALGVLAGVECARTLGGADIRLARALEVVAFVDEEGAYVSLLGSRAMTGSLGSDELAVATGRDGLPLAEALAEYGLDSRHVLTAARPPSDIAGYIELHIEQGPVLESAGLPIGVVSGIVGIHRAELEFTGMANHAGTTPMEHRRDALRAAAETIVESYRAFEAARASDMRLTFGAIAVAPNASNVIPGSVRLSQEIRGPRTESIEELYRECSAVAEGVAGARGVTMSNKLVSFNPPALMDPAVGRRIADACARLGYGCRTMPSGAGHDAQSFARRCPTGMIFIPSEAGVSHNASERTSRDCVAQGLAVLYEVLAGWLCEESQP